MPEEWTAEWLQKLDHKFGDDGSFWISYDDLLRKYQAFDRTRLFSSEWKVASIWTTLDVSWTLDYHDTKFAFSLSKSGPVVIVFSQLDERYFKGLEGQYRFELSFRVHKAGEEDYVVRSQNYYRMNRSVNVELDLDAGEYVVVVKVDAQRNERIMSVEEVVRAHAKERREKLLRIGQAYDIAHAKGKILETAEEKEAREAYETRRKERERRKMAKFIREGRAASRKTMLRRRARDREKKEKEEAKSQARVERKAARRKARAKTEEEEEEKKKSENSVTTESAADEVKEKKEDGEDGGTKAENTKTAADEKRINVQLGDDKSEEGSDNFEILIAAGKQAEGSTASTETGDGAHTPTSSTIASDKTAEGEDEELQEDDAYVTAAEEVLEKTTPSSAEESSTPKPAKPTTPPRTNSVDVGVQTGPGLPPSPFPPPSPPRRGPPPPQYMQSMYTHPPPPMLGAQYVRGPPRDLNHVPPHLRAAYAAQQGPRGQGQYVGPPPSVTVVTSDSSDSELDDDTDDASEISEEEIDACIAENRARAVRAAAAAAKAVHSSGGSTAAVEEPLDEFEKDPWNAVGVFGLRVYYRMPEASEVEKEREVVRLRVERPNPFQWDDSSDDGDDGEADDEKEEDNKKEESQVLDVDDSAKDAVGETPPTPGPELLKELVKEEKGEEVAGSEEERKHETKKEPLVEDDKKSV